MTVQNIILLHTYHGGSASQCCLGATVKVINGKSVAERPLKMGIDINATCRK